MRTWVFTCDGIMDALFGVGLNREVGGAFKTAIQWINHISSPHTPVVSCDIPSGIHADTGEMLGVAVKAAATVTFSCGKPGLYLDQGRPHAGEVHIVDIGIPFDLIHQMIRKVPEPVRVYPEHGRFVLPDRPRTAHKGDFGKVFILAGCEGFTGAPVLAAGAAVRVGAGLVFLGVPRNIYPVVAVKCNEAMPFPLSEEYDAILEKARGCDVALIGPGLGRAPETEALVCRLLSDLDMPVVLDADGINVLQQHKDILRGRTHSTILTPHDGEFARLAGPVGKDRMSSAVALARDLGCIVLLKGHKTCVTDGVSGYLTDDDEVMAEKLLKIMEDPAHRTCLSENGKAIFARINDEENYQEAIAACYR